MVSHRVECPLCSAGITDFLSHSWFPGKLTNERKYVIRPDVGECTRGRRLPAKGFYHNLMLPQTEAGFGFWCFLSPPGYLCESVLLFERLRAILALTSILVPNGEHLTIIIMLL